MEGQFRLNASPKPHVISGIYVKDLLLRFPEGASLTVLFSPLWEP